MSLLLSIVRPRPVAVVYSAGVFEGNAVEVVRALLRKRAGRVVWLVHSIDDPHDARRLLDHGGYDPSRIRICSKWTVQGIFYFLTARVFFFTDRIYGGPEPKGKRIFVNLWHGDGPKTTLRVPVERPPCHLVVSGTRIWGVAKAEAFGCDETQLVISGNPRIDQYGRPASDANLEALGIDPAKKLVLWAPTYRAVRGSMRVTPWSDSGNSSPFQELLNTPGFLPRINHSLGLQVVIKPHYHDLASFGQFGTKVITDRGLVAKGVGLYQVIARADALVTDYSSIWTDYVPLGRPIGLYCPDLDDYTVGRGFSLPDFASYAPGPIFRSLEGLEEFLSDVATGDDPGRRERQQAIDALGIVDEPGATERMLEAAQKLADVRGVPLA